MNNFVSSLLMSTTLLTAEKLPLPEEPQSQFFYLSGGLSPLPTVSVGYQKLYGSFGSDVSISGAFFPIRQSRGGLLSATAAPSIHYKQLFFGGSRSYLGLKTGFYWGGDGLFGDAAMDFGGVVGFHIKRSKGQDFFELGLSPYVYSFKESYSPKTGHQKGAWAILPLFSISYGIML